MLLCWELDGWMNEWMNGWMDEWMRGTGLFLARRFSRETVWVADLAGRHRLLTGCSVATAGRRLRFQVAVHAVGYITRTRTRTRTCTRTRARNEKVLWLELSRSHFVRCFLRVGVLELHQAGRVVLGKKLDDLFVERSHQAPLNYGVAEDEREHAAAARPLKRWPLVKLLFEVEKRGWHVVVVAVEAVAAAVFEGEDGVVIAADDELHELGRALGQSEQAGGDRHAMMMGCGVVSCLWRCCRRRRGGRRRWLWQCAVRGALHHDAVELDVLVLSGRSSGGGRFTTNITPDDISSECATNAPDIVDAVVDVAVVAESDVDTLVGEALNVVQAIIVVVERADAELHRLVEALDLVRRAAHVHDQIGAIEHRDALTRIARSVADLEEARLFERFLLLLLLLLFCRQIEKWR